MATYEYSPPDVDSNRAHLLVDDVFDIHLLRTEEGLTIDIFEHEREQLVSLSVLNPRNAEV